MTATPLREINARRRLSPGVFRPALGFVALNNAASWKTPTAASSQYPSAGCRGGAALSSGLHLTEESIFRFSPERQLCDCAACARELLSRSHRRIGLACSQSSRIAIVRRSTSGGRGSLF